MFGLTGRFVRRMAHAAAIAAVGFVVLLAGERAAEAETRTLKLYHVHLRENTDVTFKRNGRFLRDGLRQANWALRDWRESKPTEMDPMLLDMLWEIYRQSGSRGRIHILGGYRSPATNRTLRSRSSGVAQTSLHMSGKAIDFFIPDVPLSKVRAIALQTQAGGVGYYPRSGSPFVHIDTGKGRYWPRMNRSELARIFPNGNTIYLPADGNPLPGYQQAVASFERRRGSGQVLMAEGGGGGNRSFLARLFGGGSEAAEDEADAEATPSGRPARPAAPAAPVRRAPEPAVQVAAARPTPPAALPAGVAMPDRDNFDTASRRPTPQAGIPAPATEIAALTRVPLPTTAPVRATVAPAPVVEAPTQVAAITEPEAASPAAPGQLAYAVPTPVRRPAFEAVLQASADTPVSAEQANELAAMASALGVPQAPDASVEVTALALAPEPRNLVVPVSNPRLSPAAEAAVDARSTIASALAADAAAIEADPSIVAVEGGEALGSSPTGKSGRVLRVAAQRPVEDAASHAETIASRIEIASLVTEPEERPSALRNARPPAEMLVVNVPVSAIAAGFARTQGTEASDRFTGTAVRRD